MSNYFINQSPESKEALCLTSIQEVLAHAYPHATNKDLQVCDKIYQRILAGNENGTMALPVYVEDFIESLHTADRERAALVQSLASSVKALWERGVASERPLGIDAPDARRLDVNFQNVMTAMKMAEKSQSLAALMLSQSGISNVQDTAASMSRLALCIEDATAILSDADKAQADAQSILDECQYFATALSGALTYTIHPTKQNKVADELEAIIMQEWVSILEELKSACPNADKESLQTCDKVYREILVANANGNLAVQVSARNFIDALTLADNGTALKQALVMSLTNNEQCRNVISKLIELAMY